MYALGMLFDTIRDAVLAVARSNDVLVAENQQLRGDVTRLATQADDAIDMVGVLRSQLSSNVPADMYDAETLPMIRAATECAPIAHCVCGLHYTAVDWFDLPMSNALMWSDANYEIRDCAHCGTSLSVNIDTVAA